MSTPIPCVQCGVDSVATCVSCGQRVCNAHMVVSAERSVGSFATKLATGMLHPVRLTHPVGESFVNQSDGPLLDGFVSGPPRCYDCRVRDAAAAEKDFEKHQADQARRIAEARKRLPGATDPAEIAGLLADGGGELDVQACLGAWSRLIAAGALKTPEMELVRMRFRKPRFRDAEVKELWRRPAWTDEKWSWLDSTGAQWHKESSSPGVRPLSEDSLMRTAAAKGSKFFEKTFLAPPKHPVRLEPYIERQRNMIDGGTMRARSWKLDGGDPMEAAGSPSASVVVDVVTRAYSSQTYDASRSWPQ